MLGAREAVRVALRGMGDREDELEDVSMEAGRRTTLRTRLFVGVSSGTLLPDAEGVSEGALVAEGALVVAWA